MNILYCGDINTRKGIALSVISLTRHVAEPLNVYLMTLDVVLPEEIETQQTFVEKAFDRNGGTRHISEIKPIPLDFASYLDTYVKKYYPESSVTLIDATALFESMPPTANMGTRFTPACMLRLYADIVTPALPDRLLYLDYDVICRRDCSHYYHQNISRYEYVATRDYYGKALYAPLKHDYINSGVLLMNMAKIRETGLFRKCRELCRDKRLFLPDQHALNMAYTKRKIVGARYNAQRHLRSNTVFHHFSTTLHFFPYPRTQSVKPWDKEQMHNVLKLHDYDELLAELDIFINDLNLD